MKSLFLGFSIQPRIMNLNYYYMVNKMLDEKAFQFFLYLTFILTLFQIFEFSRSIKSLEYLNCVSTL